MAEGGKMYRVLRRLTGKKSPGAKNRGNDSLNSSIDSGSVNLTPPVKRQVCIHDDSPQSGKHVFLAQDKQVTIHTGNGRVAHLEGNGDFTISEDLRINAKPTVTFNTNHDVPNSDSPEVSKSHNEKPNRTKVPGATCLRYYNPALSKSKDVSRRRSMYQTTANSHDLTGRASLSPKDLIFGIPPPPDLPPRVSKEHMLRKAYSTPDIRKKYSGTPSEERKPRAKTGVGVDLEAEVDTQSGNLARWSVVSRGEDEDSGTETESEESYMEWSDDDNSVCSASSPSHKDDPYENMHFEASNTNHERAHHIAKELMTSETSYVKKLEILNKARDRTTQILGNEVAKEMFPYIHSIHALHKENMLPHLKTRLHHWKSKPEIGDIMKMFAPYLKLYTDYVKNFDNALKLVDSWNSKSPDFARMLLSLPSNGPSLNLKVQIKSHMLEPIQRVPRYKLLLQQYSKEIREDSPERADLQVALSSVTQAAIHFEDMMKHGSKMLELMELQRHIDCPISLMTTGRNLVKQGKIGKVNATTGKVVSRYVFLFNDLFMVCSEQTFYIPGLQPKYRCRQLMEIEGMRVASGDNLEVPYTFYVKTKKKAVEFSTSSEEEKTEWEELLWKVIGEKMRIKLASLNTINKRRTMMLRAEGPLGKEAPVWVHNSQVSMCMTCALEFRGLRKKHHCRACGAVVCHRCSARTARMEYDDFREHRICEECYLILQDQAITTKRESIFKARNREICKQKGYLQASFDKGKSWHRRWFEVHEGGDLYCYKAQQDICPMSTISGAVPEVIAIDCSKVILLHFAQDKYYLLKDENEQKLAGWLKAITNGS